MVISHKNKYLFIEIPLTGSWAIRQELCDYYGGEPILHKHATYPEFERIATREEKKYFKFAAVRNPLNETVSAFTKLKNNHKGIFSNPHESLKAHAIDYADIKLYESARNPNHTFEQTFLSRRIWERPYSSMIEVSSDYLDFAIRFERLNEDFSAVMEILNIEIQRPLPIVNKTEGRKEEWRSYYSPAMIAKAKQIYGPFMQKWGYEFPPGWGPHRVSTFKKLEFEFVNLMKKVYLLYFRYNDNAFAKVIRMLNAQFKSLLYR